jgi:hypothetical protein
VAPGRPGLRLPAPLPDRPLGVLVAALAGQPPWQCPVGGGHRQAPPPGRRALPGAHRLRLRPARRSGRARPRAAPAGAGLAPPRPPGPVVAAAPAAGPVWRRRCHRPPRRQLPRPLPPAPGRRARAGPAHWRRPRRSGGPAPARAAASEDRDLPGPGPAPPGPGGRPVATSRPRRPGEAMVARRARPRGWPAEHCGRATPPAPPARAAPPAHARAARPASPARSAECAAGRPAAPLPAPVDPRGPAPPRSRGRPRADVAPALLPAPHAAVPGRAP